MKSIWKILSILLGIAIIGIIIGSIFILSSTKKYIVSFDTDGGTEIPSIVVKKNETVDEPVIPEKNGYRFVEWQLNGKKYNFNTKVVENITLKAKWIKDTEQSEIKNSYKVTFNSDGGTNINSQIVKEGEKVVPPTIPSRSGYTFVEWQLNGVRYDFNTPVVNNITLKAIWKKINIQEKDKYVVTFDVRGGTNADAQIIKEGEKATQPANPTRVGYRFIEWQLNGVKYNFNTPVKGNITLVAIWKEINYTVQFNSNGGTNVDTQVVKDGEKVIQPLNPTRSGYRFVEWQLNGVKYDFNSTVSNDLTLVAMWEKVKPGISYTVKFDSNGGNKIASKKVIKGEKVDKPANPTRSGYLFVEWQLNGKKYNFDTKVTKNITLKAKWVKSYTVKFDSNGGTSVSSQTIKKGGKVIQPKTPPTRSGYLFVEWQLNGKKYNFNTKVTKNITLKAKWKVITTETYYKITFDSNGGSKTPEQRIKPGEKIQIPQVPTRSGYKFSGWELNGVIFDFNSTVSKNITLKAKWIKLYTVKFDSNGGNKVSSKKVIKGEKVEQPANPTRSGYIFVEWQLNGKKYNFSSSVNKDITLKAKWVKSYTIKFDSNGGTEVSSKIVAKGDKVIPPTQPTRNGYEFVEWQLNGKKYNFNSSVNKDITLKAKWKVITTETYYKITFDSNGGSKVPEQRIKPGEQIQVPKVPTRSGYKFGGWVLNGVMFDFNSSVSKNITLKAKWLKLYTVKFDSNGGNKISSKKVAKGEKVIIPESPKRSGYRFVEWQLNGKKYDFNSSVNKDITLKAKWVKTYTVKFNSNGGSSIASQSIKNGGQATKPSTVPTRSGYKFVEWQLNGKKYNFNTKITKNITLTAKWIKTYTVKFNSNGGTNVETQTINSGSIAQRPTDPTRLGFIFKGWLLNNQKYNFNTKITKNITLQASWEVIPDYQYTITFDSTGGSPVNSQTVEINNKINQPQNPKRDGYEFVGWFVNDTLFDFNEKITENKTLIAKWIEKGFYMVTFDSVGGTKVDSQKIKQNEKVTKPTDPTRNGYIFKGWILDNSKYDFNNNVNKNINLKADWEKIIYYTVKFNSNGGTTVKTQSIQKGNKVTNPGKPTRIGYTFKGWYLGKSKFDFKTIISEDITLKASWEMTRKFKSNSEISSSVMFDKRVSSIYHGQTNVQGFASDGKNFYVALMETTKVSDYTDQKTVIGKFSSGGSLIDSYDMGRIGHSNGLAYDSKRKVIVIAPCNHAQDYIFRLNLKTGAKSKVQLYNKDNTKYLRDSKGNITRGVASIAYNSITDEYIAKTSSTRLTIFTPNKNGDKLIFKKHVYPNVSLSDGLTGQAIYCDGYNIYSVYNTDDGGNARNYIGVFDYNTGKRIRNIALGSNVTKTYRNTELEGLTSIGKTFYANGNVRVSGKYRLIVYKLNLLK